jgi:hypothetical protein
MKVTCSISVLILLVLSLQVHGQTKKKNDLELRGLKGKVKQVSMENFEARSNYSPLTDVEKLVDTLKWFFVAKEITTYNHKGGVFKIDDLMTYKGDSTRSKHIYIYSHKGNNIECDVYISDSLTDKNLMKYDGKKNLIEQVEQRKDKIPDISYKRHNPEEPIPLKDTLFLSYNKWAFKYDNKGNMVEENCYNRWGKVSSTTTSKYDNKGNRIERLGKSDARNNRDIYKYDNKGNMVEEDSYSDNMLSRKSFFKYDENGHKVEQNDSNYMANEAIETRLSHVIWKYDNEGDMIELDFGGSSGPGTVIHQFEYDTHGNWLKEISWSSDSRNWNKSIRKIEYYPGK